MSLPPGPAEVVEVAVGGADIEGAGKAVAGRIEDVVEVRAPRGLYVADRVGADRGIARDGSRGKMNNDARRGRRIVVVGDLVVAAAAVDEVVAAAAFVGLIGEVCIVAAAERIVGGRAPNRRDIRERVVADRGIAVRCSGRDVHRYCARRAEIADPGHRLTQRVDLSDNEIVAAPALELGLAGRHARQSRQAGEPGCVEGIGRSRCRQCLRCRSACRSRRLHR